MILTILIAVVSASMLLFAGYLLGINRGLQAREYLRGQLEAWKPTSPEATPVADDCLGHLAGMFEEHEFSIFSEPEYVAPTPIKIIPPVAIAIGQTVLDQKREALAHAMNEIAEAAHFKTVLLSDENGLPIASSRQATDLGRLAAISGYVVMFGEHIRREEDYRPVSLLFNDVSQHQVLSRIFTAGEQRLVLTAVIVNSTLALGALDPAIKKVLAVLQPECQAVC